MTNFYATRPPGEAVPNPLDWMPSNISHPMLTPDYVARLVDEAMAQRDLALTNQWLPPRSV